MEGLDFGTMLDDEQMESLFSEQDDTLPEDKKEGDEENNDKDKNKAAEVDPENMFEGTPESVGSEDNKGNEEDATPTEDGTSPDFFSSIANAFAEEGIFPDLDDETIKGIKTAADFRKAINEQIKAGLDEQQKRVAEALNNDVEPDRIRQYENLIAYLNTIDEDAISDEGEQGETLRKRILYQDYINRGFSKERAGKAVDRAITNGTDVEDAREALESNKAFFQDEYKQLLADAKADKEKEQEELKAKAERLKKSILEGDMKFFEDVDVSKDIRQKAFDAISKPIYKDPKTGEAYTAVQKLELDNSEEFLAKLGLIYALTDGLTNIEGLVKKKVKKEVKRGFSELENKINSTRRDSRGNLRFASGVDDAESILGKGMKLDL
jgi:hypothetical protein